MSYLRVGESQGEVHQNTLCRCSSTTIKVGILVLGLLLVGAGVAMYLSKVNAIAAFVTGGVGGVLILGVAIACLRGNPIKEHTLDLRAVPGNPRITGKDVVDLLEKFPNLKKLTILLRDHRFEAWNYDFDALDLYFTHHIGESSGSQYIYYRK